jgi:hypothetical protein
LERGLHQRILSFDRSLTLGYTWNQIGYTGDSTTSQGTNQVTAQINFSLNDYLLPNAFGTYDFVKHPLTTWGYGLIFQSPSQCWRIVTSILFDPTLGRIFNAPSVSLNLTGSGFEGMNEVSSTSSSTGH